ncbi:YggS family pyridoxal phosphate-dependent enzyme [Bacteroides caecigallinarum]|uniref:YggS family pyridoxal phosphate-dependent enzyme n=1 Tax=Bacteroides caecigallinarum TaxID=1411144 RepID=UPI00195EE109|nr:YggS family pyridoxal phosphate-dependent enzyme [Bacteroides caecigallinarum]MBM6890546.1 YggS family pyridoxal phosphate-dependent enzyme [Bacteroides caecigallinarum]
MDIKAILDEIKAELPQTTRLVAVSKFHPASAIQEAYDAGQRIFGESKVQELEEKHDILPQDIEWHFIGHLQTNKVKYIAPYISMIHAVDSFKLLTEINKQAAKAGRVIPCLLEIHVAKEETKFGFTPDECMDMLNSENWKELTNVSICGIMGMATNTDDVNMIEQEFSTLASFFENLKSTVFRNDDSFRELSMGMSEDYHLAIKHGSTLVRIGSKIFGIRNY